MHLSDRITGLCLALLGSLAFWGGSRLPAVPGQDVGPAAFPMVIGTGLVLCGLMIAFGMVVIAGIVGSGGLGQTIYGAIRKLNVALSVNAAIAIVILTIIIDRISQSAGTPGGKS